MDSPCEKARFLSLSECGFFVWDTCVSVSCQSPFRAEQLDDWMLQCQTNLIRERSWAVEVLGGYHFNVSRAMNYTILMAGISSIKINMAGFCWCVTNITGVVGAPMS
jgi:hypothetical protein